MLKKAVCAAALVASAGCESLTLADAPPENAELNQLMQSLHEETRATALSAAVAQGGEVFWSAGFGEARPGRAADGGTRYRVGSVSKVITAAVLARMADDGVVDWSDPVSLYVPEFDRGGDALTLRRLSDHTGGVRHYRFNESTVEREPVQWSGEALHLFVDDPLAAAPGEAHLYSSYSYTLLAAALERAGNAPFPALLNDYLTELFGLASIGPDVVGEQRVENAALYEGDAVADARDLSHRWAAGGLRADVEDLARLAGLVTRGAGALSPGSLREMTTPGRTLDGAEQSHSAGWVVDRLETGEAVFFHDGEVQGGHAHMMAVPDWDMSAAIAVNRGSFFSLGQGVALLCAAREMETCPAPIRQSTLDAQINQAFGTLQAALDSWNVMLADGDLSAFDTLVHASFDGAPFGSREALREGLETAFAQGGLIAQDSQPHVQLSGVAPGSLSRVSGRYFDRVFTEAEDLRLILAYDGDRWRLIRIEPREETQ